ncbi:hypothetical protein AeMF1_000795 [Aphanomyces euteiches]|nr:hypothetical protein AeMF1_000795 [Aphanomyces euteiches]
MSNLWKSESADDWERVFAKYDEVCASLEGNLRELEKWYQNELPALVQQQGHIMQPQLSKLMQWKLSKGKWRPRLQSFVDGLPKKDVEDLSRKAFAACRKKAYKEAITEISSLKGVGPATASAVIAAFDPAVPFMGDEALNALSGVIGARQYTLPHFMRFLDALQAKAKVLSSSNEAWTAQRVQLCLWLEVALSSSSPASKKKRPASKSASTATETSTKRARKSNV